MRNEHSKRGRKMRKTKHTRVAPNQISHSDTQRIGKRGIRHTRGASESFSNHLVYENIQRGRSSASSEL